MQASAVAVLPRPPLHATSTHSAAVRRHASYSASRASLRAEGNLQARSCVAAAFAVRRQRVSLPSSESTCSMSNRRSCRGTHGGCSGRTWRVICDAYEAGQAPTPTDSAFAQAVVDTMGENQPSGHVLDVAKTPKRIGLSSMPTPLGHRTSTAPAPESLHRFLSRTPTSADRCPASMSPRILLLVPG